VLRGLPLIDNPHVLTGTDIADDAGVYRLTDDLALVHTIDFFTPVVDDPYTYGAIAAANALSDAYAMGATPISALNVVLYPTKTLPMEILERILRGGADKARQAQTPIIGGHTVENPEPVYGLAVTATVDPKQMRTTSGGRPDDVLVLTKPLGTGVIATALKAAAALESDVEGSIRSMLRLNRSAAGAMTGLNISAATDITGFGLTGHVVELARASGVGAEINSGAVPLLAGALRYAEQGHISAGGIANAEHADANVRWDGSVSMPLRRVLTDPQTSGGLLIAVSPADVDTLAGRLEAEGDMAAIVGRLCRGTAGAVHVA